MVSIQLKPWQRWPSRFHWVYMISKYKINFFLYIVAGIFSSAFLQEVKSSYNSILNWVMKLHLFICMCMYIFSETPLKDFPFYLLILHTLRLRYLQAHINESYMYLSSQLFFETPHKTLKFQEKLLPLQTKIIGKHDTL